jgi:hypothetical protein
LDITIGEKYLVSMGRWLDVGRVDSIEDGLFKTWIEDIGYRKLGKGRFIRLAEEIEPLDPFSCEVPEVEDTFHIPKYTPPMTSKQGSHFREGDYGYC